MPKTLLSGPVGNIHKIEISGRDRFACMADILALIAYPKDSKHRDHFAKSVRTKAVATALCTDKGWNPATPPASYIELPGENLDRFFSKGLRLLDDRLTAAKQVIPWVRISRALLANKKVLFEGGRRISNDAIFHTVAAQPAEKEHRTQSKIWHASLPVIHLAAALKIICEGSIISKVSEDASYSLAAVLNADPQEFILLASEIRWLLDQLQPSKNSRGPNAIPNFGPEILIDLVAF